jgi:peptide deformylase
MNNNIGKLLKICTDNDPILKILASEINLEDILSHEIQQLLVDMIATMKAAPGIGLAAPQINVSKRIMVFQLPSSRDEKGKGTPLTILINPTVTPINEEDRVSDFEGCLSVPGVKGKVLRYNKIEYTGYDEYGKFSSTIAEGWHARLVQHEFDHLNGILYPEVLAEEDDLLSTNNKNTHLEKWKKSEINKKWELI